MDIVEFIVENDPDQKLQVPLVAYILRDLMNSNPLAIPVLMKIMEVVGNGDDMTFDPQYEPAMNDLRGMIEGFKESQSALVALLVSSEESEIGLDLDGRVTIKLGEEEVVVS